MTYIWLSVSTVNYPQEPLVGSPEAPCLCGGRLLPKIINGLIKMTSFRLSSKSKLIALVSALLVIFLIYTAYSFYQAHLKQVAFNQHISGMDEYELCQLALSEFGMKMVEDIGRLADYDAIEQP